MKIPKILIVNGEPFNDITATGITLTKLFKDYGEDNILYVYSANIMVGEEIDTKYLKLSNKDLFKSQNLSFDNVVKNTKIDKSSSNEVKISKYKKKRKTRKKT